MRMSALELSLSFVLGEKKVGWRAGTTFGTLFFGVFSVDFSASRQYFGGSHWVFAGKAMQSGSIR